MVLTVPGMWRAHRRYTVVFLLTQLGFAAVAAMTFDKNRVFALLAWAPTLHYLMTVAEMHAARIESQLRGLRSRWLLWAVPVMALVMPHYFVSGDGGIWAPGFFFAWRHVGRVLGHLFGS